MELDMEHIMKQANSRPNRVYWTTPNLTGVRLRLLKEPMSRDVSVDSCEGMLGDTPVSVSLPFTRLPVDSVRRGIVEFAKEDGVFAKETGILENIEVIEL